MRGQKQRVVIAMALIKEPTLLIAVISIHQAQEKELPCPSS